MAQFTIEFEMAEIAGPTYEDYLVSVTSICFDDGSPRSIKFDDLSGDFIVGYNWDNSGTGLPAQTIRIESFSDVAYYKEISTNIETVVTPYTPNALYDEVTGNDLTYPYITPLTNLPNIKQRINTSELNCPSDPDFTGVRKRDIQYIIIDSGGNPGPLKTASFNNTQT